ncbi:MAG: hypothetical protein IKS41_07380 [Alphaproteobacteria bacterium]|nr:hypothetical protein [Alphaproteobacteria bacterium]
MAEEKKRSGLASYLGKYADKVWFDNQPVVESDEYSLNTTCRVKIKSDDGDSYQDVPLGPTEIYAYPDGDQTKEAVLKGILDGEGYLVPCHKNEKGDFEVITEDQQIQVIPSAENVAKASDLPRTVVKTNMLNRQSVFQSEETIKDSDGKTFHESEAYTLTHMSGGKPIGPIEYYTQPQDGQKKAAFFGILGMDGNLIPCTRNAEGNIEFTDINQQKQVIKSAENELKENPQYAQVIRTDYFMGRPIGQRPVKEYGSTYTLTAVRGKQPIAPTEYYTESPNGEDEFIGILDANGQVIPCTHNADGDLEVDNGDGQKQVIKSAENELRSDSNGSCQIIRTDYTLGQPGKETVIPNFYARINQHTQEQTNGVYYTTSKILGMGRNSPRGGRGKMGEEGVSGPASPTAPEKEDNLFSDPRAKDKLTPKR